MADAPGIPANLPVTDLQFNNARTYTGVVAALLALSITIVMMRVVSRWRSSGLQVDDYFIISAAVSGARPAFGVLPS